MNSPHTILALPFEDADLITQLKATYPGAEVHVLRKHDIAGLPLTALLRRVRGIRSDMIAASLRHSTVRRTASATELLLVMSRSRRKIYFDAEGRTHEVSFFRFVSFILPKIFFGSLLGMTSIFLNYFTALFLSVGRSPGEKEVHAVSGKGTVLFLRTDLAGDLPAGGSVTHVKGIVKGLLKLGYDVVYVADAKSEALPAEVRQVVVNPFGLLDFFDEFQLAAYNIQLALKAGALLRKYRPALIYQRLSSFNFAGGLMAKKIGAPMVIEANASEVWAKKNWSRLLFERTAVLCEKAALKQASRISIVSDVVREQLDRYRIPEEKFLVIPNGVDPEEFRPTIDASDVRARYGFDNSVVVGFIGTFTRWHGVETLFDAAMIAIRRNPRLRFLMIGDGTLRLELQNRALNEGASDYILFTGLIPHVEAPRYLAACDILVSPHLGFEDGTKFFGSPTKLFEYMAMGRPVIASRLEQIGDIITDGVNGLWMTPGNAEELADKILLLAGNSELRKQLGSRTRKDCEEKYTWTSSVQRVADSVTSTRSVVPGTVTGA